MSGLIASGSVNFQSYAKNLNRIYMVDFIDKLTQDADRRAKFKASLVPNLEAIVPAK